jgi:hypothetical protein
VAAVARQIHALAEVRLEEMMLQSVPVHSSAPGCKTERRNEGENRRCTDAARGAARGAAELTM